MDKGEGGDRTASKEWREGTEARQRNCRERWLWDDNGNNNGMPGMDGRPEKRLRGQQGQRGQTGGARRGGRLKKEGLSSQTSPPDNHRMNWKVFKVCSINFHRQKEWYLDDVLPSFRFSLAHTASLISHDARIAPSKTGTLFSEINRKSVKAN